MPRPPAPKPPHKMFFATNSLRNTSISAKDDGMYYEVVTRFWHPNVTRIIKHDWESRTLHPVAEIEGLFHPNPRVRFGPFEEGKEQEWIPADELVKSDEEKGGSFIIGEGQEYCWVVVNGRLQLFKADNFDEPLAEFHPHKRHFWIYWRMSQRAYFEIKPEQEVLDALEKLIVTYLILERKRRDSRPIRFKIPKGVPKP